MTDYISRADAIKAVEDLPNAYNGWSDTYEKACIIGVIEELPSADADGEDLIIKGAKGIQDGLYNIKDGKLFKYKAKGGTVRTYPIVPSADADAYTRITGLVPDARPQMEHDREWIIGCIQHDGFIKTDRFDKANQIILEALSADAVSRESYIKAVGYVKWLEKLIVDSETFEWLCEDSSGGEWCAENCRYDSNQAECLRHLYEVSKGGDDE